jgi:uncharacterized protein YndB with AHSA1/START domain
MTVKQDKTITITRLLDAPRELVFQCWLDPKHLVQWHSAGGGWTTPYAETDPRPGGKFKIGFADPEGKNSFDFTGAYVEILAPSRLVYTIDDGRPITITLEDRDGKTFLTLILTLEAMHTEEQQREGWSAMLENLDTHLTQEQRT